MKSSTKFFRFNFKQTTCHMVAHFSAHSGLEPELHAETRSSWCNFRLDFPAHFQNENCCRRRSMTHIGTILTEHEGTKTVVRSCEHRMCCRKKKQKKLSLVLHKRIAVYCSNRSMSPSGFTGSGC